VRPFKLRCSTRAILPRLLDYAINLVAIEAS
jgi:hypothetical protein